MSYTKPNRWFEWLPSIVLVAIVVIAAALVAGMMIVGVASADPSGTCPYAYCEYVAPRPPIPTGPPYYPPLVPLDRLPKPAITKNVTIINVLPPVAPTVKPKPVHFFWYPDAVEIPPPLTRAAAPAVDLPTFKPPATGDGGVAKPAHKPVVIVVKTAPLPPTATRGPVHFPLYQPYSMRRSSSEATSTSRGWRN